MQYMIASLLGNIFNPIPTLTAFLFPVLWRNLWAVPLGVFVVFTLSAVLFGRFGLSAYLHPVAWVQLGIPFALYALIGAFILRPILMKKNKAEAK